MMTLTQWKLIPLGDIVRIVITCYDPLRKGKTPLKMYIVKKGGGHDDWAIYSTPWRSDYSDTLAFVMSQGDKLIGETAIREIFPCELAVLNLYRP